MSFDVHISLGAFRACSVEEAIQRARTADEPVYPRISVSHAQICPQNPGRLTVDDAESLRIRNPDVQFRLHANVQAEGWSSQADASTFGKHEAYFRRLQALSEALDAPAYTWHAGMRRYGDLAQVLHATMRMEDLWGIDVGVEGLYPTPDDRYILSTWEEYRTLLDSGVKYALDMSHLNILAFKTHERNEGLIREMLDSPACIEVHLSGNAGDADTHGQLAIKPWWWDLLDAVNPQATFFTEGGQIRPKYF